MQSFIAFRSFVAFRLILAAMVLVSGTAACSRHQVIAKFDAGEGRSISIFAKRWYEDNQPILYQVEVEGRTVVPPTYISSEDPEDVKRFRLRLVSNKARTVYGVVDEKLPQKIFILHNFATGATWPRWEGGPYEQAEQKAEENLRELQKDHPEVAFVL